MEQDPWNGELAGQQHGSRKPALLRPAQISSADLMLIATPSYPSALTVSSPQMVNVNVNACLSVCVCVCVCVVLYVCVCVLGTEKHRCVYLCLRTQSRLWYLLRHHRMIFLMFFNSKGKTPTHRATSYEQSRFPANNSLESEAAKNRRHLNHISFSLSSF